MGNDTNDIPELCRLTAHQMVGLLKKGEVSPAEALSASTARIEQVEKTVNAMPTVCRERAEKSLDTLEQRALESAAEPGWLAGLPIAIKDLSPVAGVLTTWGTVGLKDFVPTESDPLVERLEQRGGTIIGKTNTPEMGAGGNTFNTVFGMTRNPWDISKNAGGSSGGAAVSLAAGEVWLSHGSDLAGSLRTPAAYCGVVGLRPTPGRAGGGPAPTAFEIEGVQGPMARNVLDCALFLDAMTGFDPRQPISLEAPARSFQDAVLHDGIRPRIAYSADLNGFASVEPEIDAIMRSGLAKAVSDGAEVDEGCPPLDGLERTYMTLRGMLYGAVNARFPEEVQQHFKATLKENIRFGKQLGIEDVYDAQRNRTVLYHAMRSFLSKFDVLACPVVGLEQGPVEEEYPGSVDGVAVNDYVDWLRFSFLSTTTSLPSISVPIGFTKSRMPVGIQLIGPPRGEAKLLSVARFIERSVGIAEQLPINPR